MCQMPPPQNITPVEWAIAKIKDTLRKRKGPGWSEQDFSEFQIAWHIVSDKNETVRVRLTRRFADAGDRLLWRITSRSDQAEWESFGRRIENILGTFPNAFPIGGASRLIYRMVGGAETGWWGEKEMEVLVNAVGLVGFRSQAIPFHIQAEFLVNWLALVSFLRHQNRNPGVTDFATVLCARVLSEAKTPNPTSYDSQLDCLREFFQCADDRSNRSYRPKLTLGLLERLSKGVPAACFASACHPITKSSKCGTAPNCVVSTAGRAGSNGQS